MNVVGIIAEYNPFHSGHAYHLAQAKKAAAADAVLVVMSGSFVQRGGPAITDKYRRAEMALRGGADVVLELDPAAACGSAERFAAGAVKTLAAAGCVTHLAFGTETENFSLLQELAESSESEAVRERLKDRLKQGVSYPQAAAEALQAEDPAFGSLLAGPNNLLAAEYLKAIRREGAPIRPVPILREGSSHGEAALEGRFAGAGAIRAAICRGDEAWRNYVPEEMQTLLDYHLDEDDFSFPLSAKLLRLSREELLQYEDVNDDLAGRILAAAPYVLSFRELTEKISTRAYTAARVRRVLTHILLERRKEAPFAPGCLKLLGLRAGSALPALLKERAQLPLVTKTADDTAGLSSRMTESASLYAQAVRCRTGLTLPDDYRRSPVILH